MFEERLAASLFWEFMFWVTAAFLLIPFPFKLGALVMGRDKRPIAAVTEELVNALFHAFGLIAFWGYVHNDNSAANPVLWYGWLVIAILWSFIALFKSAKIDYAVSQIGSKATKVLALVGILLFLPMYIAVFEYAWID
ncbi:hypothetical protein [Shewanella sp. Isolate7]|uniref:hypothetical protein n=1 Tax=Shewanella sp. Isolate7 TaxID=2908528 RepID=UPI001EFC8287|nr:hypothetical protein [Shewanella sp. Isolate7]MCG9723641.1 hypothetical protein [Shewanella sp. Isolate7]